MEATVTLTPQAAADTATLIAELRAENHELRQTIEEARLMIRQLRVKLATHRDLGAA